MLTNEQVTDIANGWGNQAVDALVRDWRELRKVNDILRAAVDNAIRLYGPAGVTEIAKLKAQLAALTAERDSWADEARDAKGEVIRVSAERNAARSACIAFRSWLAAYPAIDPAGSLENVARLVVAALKE